jgi:VWFA-related protein
MQTDLRIGNPLAGGGCSRRQVLLSAASLFWTDHLASGQEEPTFSTDVKLVNLLATVLNKKGEIIRDLAKDDFSLAENGRPQTIRYFSRESDLPLTLGLMVDTSMSQQRVMDAERGACLRFLDQVLRETKDQVFIMQFDMTVHMSQALTSSIRKLDDALAFVDTPDRQQLANQSGGGTLLYDALVTASKDVMRNQHGRKALIVLSDGVDNGSDATLAAAIEAAQHADTLVYSILFSDASAYGIPLGPLMGHRNIPMGSRDGKGALSRMSKETGAGFFEVSKKQGIEQIFALIQEELRSQYSLGYVSDQPVTVSEFRKIQLTTKLKGLVVQARDRYWARL